MVSSKIISSVKKLLPSIRKFKKMVKKLTKLRGSDGKVKCVVSDIDSTLWFREHPSGPCRFAIFVMWMLSKNHKIIYLSGRKDFPILFRRCYPKGQARLRKNRDIPNFVWKMKNLEQIKKQCHISVFFDNEPTIVSKAREMGINVVLVKNTNVWKRLAKKLKKGICFTCQD